jgi:hypothetical protein
MTPADLHAQGFEVRDGALRAPDGSSVCFTPLNGRCFRLVVTLPTGSTVTAVVAALALKVGDPPPTAADTS